MFRVRKGAFALGGAGLLPQVAAVGVIATMRLTGTAEAGWGEWLSPFLVVAVVYPVIILSFLGGMWWSIAMHRYAGQGRLATLAVLPSLVALALLAALLITGRIGWGLVAIGSAVMLTLPVDRHLVTMEEAPQNWMALRIPLSLGLGGLTILAGALIGSSQIVY